MIGELYNYDGVFFRDLTITLLDKLEGSVYWTNRFTSGDVEVEVPFYYSMVGHEDMLLDAFNDDIVSDNRKTELNTDVIPRGHIVLSGISIEEDNFLNPNVFVKGVVEKGESIKTVMNKVRAIPIAVTYNCEILLESERDVLICQERLMDALWLNQIMDFEYNRMFIQCSAYIPLQSEIKIDRQKNMSSDNTISISFSIEVSTHYPAYLKEDNFNELRNVKPKRTKWYLIMENLKKSSKK